MHLLRWSVAAALGVILLGPGLAWAETKVEVKNVHLCCAMCTKQVGEILGKVEGVKGACDQKARTITITATDAKVAQKALDALAAAGFHGDTGNKDLAMKDDSGVTAGKVKSLTITGIHNCCPACCRAIKATVKKVDGVKADTAQPRMDTFEVTGEFDAAALVKALNEAGFHVKVKQ
jgi:copper chaperone CopZ